MRTSSQAWVIIALKRANPARDSRNYKARVRAVFLFNFLVLFVARLFFGWMVFFSLFVVCTLRSFCFLACDLVFMWGGD